jgi:hypothetical protein
MAVAALRRHIIGKMTKQGGPASSVAVRKFSSRLSRIREENFHYLKRLRHEITPCIISNLLSGALYIPANTWLASASRLSGNIRVISSRRRVENSANPTAQGGRNRIEFSSRSVIRQRSLLQFASLLRRRCLFEVGIRRQSDCRWRTGPSGRTRTAKSAMQGCESTCVRDRADGVVAGSLIASRSQFAHAAYKTPHFEILELVFLAKCHPE